MGLNLKGKSITGLVFLSAVIFALYNYFFYGPSIAQRVFDQKQYNLELVRDNSSVQFAYRPEWLMLPQDKVAPLKQKIYKDDDTSVYIENVIRQQECLCISLIIEPVYNFTEGSFLFADTINHDGTVSTVNGQWFIVKDGKALNLKECNFGYGSGPGNRISIFIDIEAAKQLNASTQIKYTGLNKYKYKRV